MKRSIAFAAIVALLVFSSEGRSQQPGQRTIYGAGADSCGTWLAERKTSAWFQDGEWILGFLTAANRFANVPPRHTDSAAITVWVDNYCQANPLEDLVEAATALLTTLGTKW